MLCNERNKKKMYTEIIIFLSQKRLKEGLAQLKVYAETFNNWTIISDVETLQINYGFMLKYAANGKEDTQRGELFNKILVRAYELADQLHTEEKFGSGYGYMADLFRYNKLKPAPSFDELREELLSLNAQEDNQVTEGNKTEHQLFKPHFDFTDKLFKKTLVSICWTSTEYNEACQLVNCGMSTFDLEVWISGITISLLNCFDIHKFHFLEKIHLDKSIPSLKTRTLVGIALAIYYYSDRIKMYEEMDNMLDIILRNEEAKHQIYLIQQLLLLTRETEKIDKKMLDEIYPHMLKNPYLKHTYRKIEDIELKELEEDNPEWEQDLDKMSEKILELGNLQREGADTYMGTFGMLKSYPFFRQLSHWFYPFTEDEPETKKILNEQNIKKDSILNMMLHSAAFCNSDKYSFCLSLNEIPFQQLRGISESIGDKENILNEHLGAPLENNEEEKLKTLYRQYIHDLYRFCKMWTSRKEQHDIFTDSLQLWKTSKLHDLIIKGEPGIKMANYLLTKGYYEEAYEFYNQLLDQFPINTELIQKTGFALQRLKKYPEAIRVYNQGYILRPQDSWTLKHMAHCYKKMHEEEKALQFFQLAEDINPDNLNISLQIGQCLALLGRYDEAVKYFFKVEYLGKSPNNARRAIAWCYFMTGKYEDAARFYEKIINESTPNINDWMNYGHVYLVEGNLKEAVACYQKVAETCKTHDDFIKTFSTDLQILLDAGINPTTLYIVQDLV